MININLMLVLLNDKINIVVDNKVIVMFYIRKN